MEKTEHIFDLSGTWKAKPEKYAPQEYWKINVDDSDWISIKVPSHWQRATKEFASFHGTLVYRKAFEFAPQKDKRYWLRFEGVAQTAKVWLNEAYLGAHEGYFEPFEFEITDKIREKNLLVVAVWCPRQNVKKDTALGVYGYWDASDPFAVIGGIWKKVTIIETGHTRIKNITIETHVTRDLDAIIFVNGTCDSQQSGKIKVEAPSLRYSKVINISPETKKLELEIIARKPDLWWPWERGEATLHDLIVSTDGDSRIKKFGIREVYFGKHWEFQVNWSRMFLRGTNYISEMWPAEATIERFRSDIKLMKNANMNIARVHAHVEPLEFYDIADEEGLMLWQDNSLQWTYTKESWPRLVDQTRRMIRTLKNHPSIVAYCLHNEPLPHESMGKLNRMLIKAAIEEDATRAIVPHSGEIHPFQILINMVMPRFSSWRSIDLHWYGGWYAFKKYTDLQWLIKLIWPLLKIKAEAITEFGSQSIPSKENFEKFPEYGRITKKDLTDWKKLAIHRLQPHRWKEIFGIKEESNPMDMIERSQKYQAELTKYYIELLRAHKYDNVNCILQFMFVDCWPAITWSILDYWRKPKLAYEVVKTAFEPILAFIDWPKEVRHAGAEEEYVLHIVNDTNKSVSVNITAELLNNAENVVAKKEFSFNLRPDTIIHPVKIHWKIPKNARGTWYLRLVTDTGEKKVANVYELKIH